MTTSPSEPVSPSGVEDPDLVTFVVPRSFARPVADFLLAQGLTIGQAPVGLVPMAPHDTHMAVPDAMFAEHLTRVAARFAVEQHDAFSARRVVRTAE